jgi:hypothetical protein
LRSVSHPFCMRRCAAGSSLLILAALFTGRGAGARYVEGEQRVPKVAKHALALTPLA